MTELLLASIAQAGGGAGGGAGAPSALGSPLVMMLLMFVVIYFMLIRPQQKRQKEQEAFLDALKRGDKVVTSGGIHGTISGLSDDIVTLEIAKDVRIRITRSQIGGRQKATEQGGSKAGSSSSKKAKAR